MKTFFSFNLIFTILILFSIQAANSQDGSFLALRGTFQTTQINNTDDHLYRFLSLKRTFGYAGGIDYFSNSGATGFRSGISYSVQGQRYRGIYYEGMDSVETGQDTFEVQFVRHNFESELKLSYIKIPLLLNFNSLFNENETVNLTVYAGFQLGILMSVNMKTNPPADEIKPPHQAPDYDVQARDLLRKIDVSFASGAVLNIKLSDQYLLYTGFSTDRSIMSIEKRNYDFDTRFNVRYPEDLLFPLSTKKKDRPSPRDFQDRASSNNITIGFLIGIAYKFQ